MKYYPIILIFLMSLFISSCTDTISDMGKGTLSYADSIIVKSDIFNLSSSTDSVQAIISSKPDSFLLGTFYDPKFGSIKADILAQLQYPENFKIPTGSVADSAVISFTFFSSFGSTSSPLGISIYEMTDSIRYRDTLKSNINPNLYCDKTIKLGEKFFTSGISSSTSKTIDFKLDNNFLKRFFNDTYYNKNFTKFFKGIYLTTNFGSATMLNIGRRQLNLFLYYHYQGLSKDIHGKDSIINIKDMRVFPANKEVRQVNCIQHPDRKHINLSRDTVTYLSSPANLQTLISLPLDSIKKRLDSKINEKKLTINSSILKVNITETDKDTLLHPVVKYVLLVKDDATLVKNILVNGELPVSTSSVLGRYTVAQIGTTSNYERYYSFDIAALIANELKNSGTNATTLKLRMIPVAVETTTSTSGTTSISSIKQQYLMSAVTLRSGKVIDPKSGDKVTAPLTLKMIYSGF